MMIQQEKYSNQQAAAVAVPISSVVPAIQGNNIYLASTPARAAQKTSVNGVSSQNYTLLLNQTLDKLFDYLLVHAQTEKTAYLDLKLRLMMDLLSEIVFKSHLDSSNRGFCYGWELF